MDTRLFENKELKVSLSGNLGFVSLDEVLRLLTRSNQQGSVDVSGDGVRGRIFIIKGGVALATTSDDQGMHRHLVKSGLVDEDSLQNIESGGTTLAPIAEKSAGALVDLLREMTVESVYQLGLKGDAFEVDEGQKTRYASPNPFDLESIIDDSKQRLIDWTEVSKTVSDLATTMNLARNLGERDEVSIGRDAWRVLSEVGSGSSVVSIASELGTTDFWTARIASDLINDELLIVSAGVSEDDHVPAAVSESWGQTDSQPESPENVDDEDLDPDESWWEEPENEGSESDGDDQSEEMPAAEEVDTPAAEAVDTPAAEAVDAPAKEANRSIFGSFAPGASAEPADAVEEGLSDVAPADEVEDDDEVEEDTEAFLEKVFSELDSSTEADEEGYGLLRRRRMGALRDSSGDA